MCVTKSPHKWVSYYYNLLQPGYFFLFYPFTCRDMHSRFIVVSVVDIRIILFVTRSHFSFVPSTNTFEINQKLYFHLYIHLLTCKGCLGPISTYMSEKSFAGCCCWCMHPLGLLPPLPPPQRSLSVRPSIPFFLIHLHGWPVGRLAAPFRWPSKLRHVIICTSRMYHVHPGDDF